MVWWRSGSDVGGLGVVGVVVVERCHFLVVFLSVVVVVGMWQMLMMLLFNKCCSGDSSVRPCL